MAMYQTEIQFSLQPIYYFFTIIIEFSRSRKPKQLGNRITFPWRFQCSLAMSVLISVGKTVACSTLSFYLSDQ